MAQIFNTPPAALSPAPEKPTPRLVTVNHVHWHSVLDFTQLFRGFRLAINPAKITLALLAILLIYAAGRAFDAAWGPQVYKEEIRRFQEEKPEYYRQLRPQQLKDRESALASYLDHISRPGDQLLTRYSKSPRMAYSLIKSDFIRQFHEDLREAHERRLRAETGDSFRIYDSTKTPREVEEDDRKRAADALANNMRRLKDDVGHGIFDSFLSYEMTQFDSLVDNTLSFIRVAPVRVANSDTDIEGAAITGSLISKDSNRFWRSDTVAGSVANMTITAPLWLFTATGPMQWRPENADTWGGWFAMIGYRALYLFSLAVFAAFCLIVIALTGATIARLSALELAGVERAPLKDVFLFASRRLWLFVKAPIMPFLIILVAGLALAIAGLIGAIPFVGEILLGLIFILFLVAGFVLTLLLLGVLGGFHLLYPTIAVEGSDAFDALSRSFAYVYARPWRLLLYTVVSLIYGAITFLFISFAVYLVLLLTHTFVGWGTSLFGYNHGWFSGAPKLETLWPIPHFARLITPTNWYAMSWSEFIGSLFLHFWVYLLIAAIGAYVVSYYFSTHTIMYLLMRRSVDGQALTEVYVDEPVPTPPPAPLPNSMPPPPPTSVPPPAPAT